MKKHLLYFCTIGISLFLTSCIAGIERDISISAGEDAEISVEQAREFFEQELLTRNDDTPSPNILSPGDFTPQWDNAKVSQNYRIACVDVPIIPRFGYRAIRSEYKLGKATAYTVRVSQKLIVVKDRESGDMAQYIMSIIPDKEFAAKHKGDISNLFLNANDRGRFSGILLYTCHGIPVRLSKYIDGKRVEGISTCGVAGKQKYKELLLKIYKSLSDIKVLRYAGITSRSGEDPGWDFDAGEIEDVIIIGSGPSDNEEEEEDDDDDDDDEEEEDDDDDGPPNQQIDPEDLNKAPLENPDDEENIGNEGNENNNNKENSNNQNNDNSNNNESIKKMKDDVVAKLSSPNLNKLKSFIITANITFQQNNKETKRLKIGSQFVDGNYKATIYYNSQYWNLLNNNGKLLAVYHEYIHGFLYYNNWGKDYSHKEMLESKEYKQGLRNLFPNETEEFYNMIQYIGCSDIYKMQLDEFEQTELRIIRNLYFYNN